MKTLHFSIDIRASRQTVWETLLGRESYRLWTAAFAEGSYLGGTWDAGTRMRFLVPTGEGMVTEVAEHRAQEFLSLRHIGFVKDGVEDTESEMVKAWTPAFENYTLSYAGLSLHLAIDMFDFVGPRRHVASLLEQREPRLGRLVAAALALEQA